MQIEPENHAIVIAVCNVYSKKRYFSVAIGHCKKAHQLAPTDYSTMNRLAWLYAKKRIHPWDCFI